MKKDWHSLKKLRLLHTVSLNSAQQSLAIENNKVLEKIHKLEIRVKPHSPLKLSQNLESCHILLDSGEDLNKYISKKSYLKSSPSLATVLSWKKSRQILILRS